MVWKKKADIRGPRGTSVAQASVEGDNLIVGLDNGVRLNAGSVRGPRGLPGVDAVPADEATGTYIGAAGTQSQAAVDARIAAAGKADAAALSGLAMSAGRKVVFLGDSHTEGIGTSDPVQAFARRSLHLAGTYNFSVAKSVNAGIGGNTSTQMLARIDPLLTDDVGLLVLEAGANDSKLANFTPAQFAANIIEMVRRARVKNIPVVLVGVPPKEASVTSDNTRFMANIDIYNSWMRFFCQTEGIPFADIHPALTDPTTFMLKTAYANAAVQHINSYGHEVIAQILAPKMRAAIPFSTIPESAQRQINLVSNGFMAGEGSTGGSTGLPPGWTRTSAVGPTYSITDDNTGRLPGGRWLTVDIPAGQTDSTIQFSIGSKAAVGDVLAMSAVVLIDDQSGDWENNAVAGTANAFFQLRRAAAGTGITPSFDRTPGLSIGSSRFVQDRTWYVGTVTAAEEYFFTFSAKKPSASAARIRLGAVSVINLTQSGLVDWS